MKKKQMLALLLAVMMLASLLSACGSGNGNAAGGTIKIGWIGPLTGGVAQYGLAVKAGADLYIEQINAAGGINGKTVEMISYDDEGDAAKALTGYNSLMDAEVAAILGCVTTGPMLAVQPESTRDNTPMITASATAAAVTVNADTGETNANVFRACFTDPFQGEKMAKFAKEELGAATAAILFDNGDNYPTGIAAAFKETCEEIGLELVAEESYASGSVDFSGQLTNIASKNPDVLLLPDYYNDVALIAAQARDAGLTATLLGCDGWTSTIDVISDPTLIENSYFCSGYSAEDTRDIVQNFLKDYRAKYGDDVSVGMFSALGYDAAAILCDALTKAEESGAAAGSDDYKQAIIDAMSSTNKEYVTGNITFDEHNDPQKTAAIIQIVDGKEVFWGNF